jgi:hypothetical protein
LLKLWNGVVGKDEGDVVLPQVGELIAVLKQPKQVASSSVHRLQFGNTTEGRTVVEVCYQLRENEVEDNNDEDYYENSPMLLGDSPSTVVIEPLHLLIILILEGVGNLAEESLILVFLILIFCRFLYGFLDEDL